MYGVRGCKRPKTSSKKEKEIPMKKPHPFCLHCNKKTFIEVAFLEFKGHPHLLPTHPGEFGDPSEGANGGVWISECDSCRKPPKRKNWRASLRWLGRDATLLRSFHRFPDGTGGGGVSLALADEKPEQGGMGKYVHWCHNCHAIIPDGERIVGQVCGAGLCAGWQRSRAAEAARVIAIKAEKQRKRAAAKALKRERDAGMMP